MQLAIKYGKKTIYFDVIYRKRKTMAIKVEAPDKVMVIVPVGMKEEAIKKRVLTKADWIVKKLEEVKDLKPAAAPRKFVKGEPFMYLGNTYPLQIDVNAGLKAPEVKLDGEYLMISAPSKSKEVIKEILEKWYRERAREVIIERIEFYQPLMGVKPARVTIKEQKRRWGSCSSRGNLNFNWKLIMAPREMIDYVVVHEMAHLVHLNHSKQFWGLVEAILPDYKVRKKWLDDNGQNLSF